MHGLIQHTTGASMVGCIIKVTICPKTLFFSQAQHLIGVFITTASFNASLTLSQADERVIPFLMASHRGGHAEKSIPAEAPAPEGPTAGQWREEEEATGARWHQGTDSHSSGTAPSTGGGWVCIRHLRGITDKSEMTS